MIIQFHNVSPILSKGEFGNSLIEIRKGDDKLWVIFVNGQKTKTKGFVTREKAFRRIERAVEKVIEQNKSTAVAVQRPFSPQTKNGPRPTPVKRQNAGNASTKRGKLKP